MIDMVRHAKTSQDLNTATELHGKSPLDRRTVLKTMGTIGAIGSLSSIGSADDEHGDNTGDEASFDVIGATVAEIYSAILTGETTACEVTAQYLERIEAYDDELNSIITVNPDAMERAQSLDEAFASAGPVGPLHGIPIILKDNIDTDDMPTTAGNVLFEDTIPPDDAYITAQLRAAGGIILAKGNMGEFARGSLSSLGGQTYNPYGLDRSPGGSSAGPGAAVAANLATLGVGTDTGGSVRIPAAFNSLVGLRPTTGLISRDGIVPLSETLDTAGPMTKTVADAAAMLDVMAGYDPSDPVTAESVGNIPMEGYTSHLDIDGLEDARLGVIREYIEEEPEETGVEAGQPLVVTDLIESAIGDLEAAGATIIDPVTIPDLDELVGEGYITGFEFERDLNEYLDELGDAAPVDTQQEILESGTIEGGIIERFRASRDIDVETLDENVEYLSGLRARQTLRENLFAVMAENDLDAFIYPTASRTPAEIDADRPSGINTTLSPVAAFPSITVPAGYTSETELPVGLEFLAKPFEEPLMFELAYSYEQNTMLRHPPDGFGPLPEDADQ